MQNLPKRVPAFDQLLSLEKIEVKDLEILSPDEKAEFINLVYNQAWAMETGRQLDLFMKKTEALLDNDFIREINQYRIVDAIKTFATYYGRMPNKSEIALQTGLSRKAVSKHYEQLSNNPGQDETKDAVRIMTPTFMAHAIKLAGQGDLKAIKLCIDFAQGPKTAAGSVNNQNNFIQINKTVINQQVLQQLKPEQLKQIEEIVAAKDE